MVALSLISSCGITANMRISKYWFRKRKDNGSHRTSIRLYNPKKGWSTACQCNNCEVKFNRTFESTKFGFDKCDKCSMRDMNKTMFTEDVRAKISKATSKWHSDEQNKAAHAKLVSERYKNKEYAEMHKKACQERSNDPKYRQKLSDSIDPVLISCRLRGIEVDDFDGFLTPDNIKERYKSKEISKECLQKADFTCDICKKRGGILNAHHLDGWHWAIDKRFDLDNLVCLCHGCHSVFHKKYGTRNNTKEQYNKFKAERGTNGLV